MTLYILVSIQINEGPLEPKIDSPPIRGCRKPRRYMIYELIRA